MAAAGPMDAFHRKDDFYNSQQSSTNEGQCWTDGDKVLRYIMTALGILSGHSCPTVRRPVIRYVSSVWHFTWILLFGYGAATKIYDTHLRFAGEQQPNITSGDNLLHFVVPTWNARIFSCSLILFFVCHCKAGSSISSFYGKLESLVTSAATRQHLPMKNRKIYRGGHIVNVTVAIALCIYMAANFIYTIVLTTLSHSESSSITFLMILGWVLDIMSQINWAFQTAFILSICWTTWRLFSEFNQMFRLEMQERKVELIENLEAYRKTHLQLCDLLITVNRILRLMLAIISASEAVQILIVLTVVIKEDFIASHYQSLWFSVIATTACMGMIILFADRTAESVSSNLSLLNFQVAS